MAASLSTEPIAKLVADKRWLITVSKDDSVSKVLEVLNQYNITSAPVYDPKTKQFITMATTMDLVAFLAFDTYFKRHKKEQIKFEVHLPDLSRPIIDVLTQRGRAEYHGPSLSITIDEHSTLRQVLEIFSTGAHRVMVGSGSPDGVKVLSQVDVVLYLLEKYDSLPASCKQSLLQLGLATDNRIVNKIVSMSYMNTALEGFRKIYRQGVSAVAILDDEDRLVGTLSSSDVRGLKIDQLNNVLEPVVSYLQKKYGQTRQNIVVNPNEGIKQVMEKIILGKVHRVWVVDPAGRPMACVTCTDVIKTVFDSIVKALTH